ncbi:MAG: adenosylcobalamin-dependent ribonucleoside-diphosphate reductase [Deltaproteobacteria bacterium]|nr:adenosylcobalamin-dependent ribonucleoside-diphosphate reductase [Deltaproteobacteria bacterium]MBW2138280.1 adenosylcobalamin-dependent ribonucleoside-diphosphate reductase [Deltaproteobacteria bacterium]
MAQNKLKLSKNALKVLQARYLRKDRDRRIVETPEELFVSVARAVADAELSFSGPSAAELWGERFHEVLMSLSFLPNSPTLMNAGKPLGQLSACFVLPVEDSMEGIFDALKDMALVQRTGGGTGFSFSRLRPKGDMVASTSGEASGPVSFMKIFDCATENIKQGGKRRGANMGVLRVDHPDILEFIEAKLDGKSLRNFNISVGITDKFMEAAGKDLPYDLIHPSTGKVRGSLKAKEVFERIVRAAWETGDPGLLFLDSINRANPTPHLGQIEATNPCGEVPLLPYESCNLGSINLARMLGNNGGTVTIDWEKLRSTVEVATRFLDNVIEVSRYPVPEISRVTRGNRKIGLGVMGFAEMLIRMSIPYDSPEAVKLGQEIMHVIAGQARRTSIQLARDRGVFPNWRGSIHEARHEKVRNATRTAIAPTGTIAIIADTSASIEPFFALAYKRTHVLGDQSLYEINPVLLELLDRYELDVESVLEETLEKGSVKTSAAIPEDIKRLFVTALDITPDRHLEIQAAFQKHVDNSVSKTVNLPADAAVQDVASIYWRAWELGLKGVTIYRYGSKALQVLELGVDEEALHYDHASRCDPEECRL